jgi:hypothetical protein
MTQFQFDLICKIIESGAPALAKELCGALDTFVQSYNSALAENTSLKTQLEASKATITEEVTESSDD